MKRLFFIVLGVLLLDTPVLASKIKCAGEIVLRPGSFPGVITRPEINPLNNPDNPFYLLASDSELMLMSINVSSNVSVCIVSSEGIVFSQTEAMTPGQRWYIAVDEWQDGEYTLYIYYNRQVLVGEFEMENY